MTTTYYASGLRIGAICRNGQFAPESRKFADEHPDSWFVVDYQNSFAGTDL